MIGNKNIVCIIPARGGSKGLPGKNIKDLRGRPLIAYSIEQAKQSVYIDRVIVDTEDSQIADVARQYGAEIPFMRPAELATDVSSTIDVLLHAVDWMQDHEKYVPDILVLLHATAPLRSVKDIDNCIELLFSKDADSVFSVTDAHRNPYFNMVEVLSDGRVALAKEGSSVTRQSAPQVYDMNASIYVWPVDVLKTMKRTILDKSAIYVMPKERSVDIDDLMDFRIAEMMLKDKVGE